MKISETAGRLFFLPLLFLLLLGGEINAQQLYTASISGEITVDPALDDTGDYSGITINIFRLGGEVLSDTVFTATTNREGAFSGTARFSEKAEYTASVSRHGSVLSIFSVILADNDNIVITAQLPGFDESLEIKSNEQTAMDTYYRVDRNYVRMVEIINSGVIEVTQDTIPVILDTWSDLFWSIRDQHPGTLAADIGTLRSVEILGGYHDEKLIARVREALSDGSSYIAAKAQVGANAIFRLQDVDSALAFLDSVRAGNIPLEDDIVLEMESIEIMINHGRENRAKNQLMDFRQRYQHIERLAEWVDVMIYDIENLFPGLPIPEFTLRLQSGGSVNSADLTGKVFLVEVVNFTNEIYKTEQTLLNLLFEEYGPDKFEIITIPIHDSRVTVNAFVEDRSVPWKVVAAGQYSSRSVFDTFNLTILPTRILVDSDGKIVRKYSGTNISFIYNDILELLNEES